MAVERTRWSDERLDDLAARMNEQYAELVAKLDRLDHRFERLESKVDELRSEFYDTRRWVLTMWLGFAALFVEIALFR